MSTIKVGLPFLYSSMKKKIRRFFVDFSHRKITLKIRIALFLTFKSKKNQRPRYLKYTHQVRAEAMLIL